MKASQLRMLGDNVLIKPVIETKTAGGLHIPGEAQARRADRAIVVRVGDSDLVKQLGVEPGQLIAIEDFVGVGTPIIVDDEKCSIIGLDEVLAVLE